ncbi:hypothetical protein ThvES_00011060 [Thiovulum sp. ES]|nr:hypothetical protein ThvES_00011060 [Thiovulum sp. ES]
MKKLFLIITILLLSSCSEDEKNNQSSEPPKEIEENIEETPETEDEVIEEIEEEEEVTEIPQDPIEEEQIIVEEIIPVIKSLYLSGVAIDGYLSKSKVSVGNKKVETNSSGGWIIEFTENEDIETEVSISGGIDTATGEKFEGVLKAPVSKDDLADENETKEPMPVTPLTTVVSAMVKSGKSKEEAQNQLAKSLGVDPATLSKDPIKTLESGTEEERKEAAKAIKKALVVQKFAESMTKSITGDGSSEESLSTFDSIVSAVANKLSSSDEVDFDEVMEDTDSIAEESVKLLSENSEVEIDVEEATQKLKAVGEITKTITIMINSIDEEKLASGEDTTTVLESTSKATEIATQKLEERVQEIATAKLEQLDDLIEDSKKVTNALVMMGGIESISKTVEEATKSANSDENSSAKSVDASDFADMISDDVIEEQSEIFEQFEDLNISTETLLEVATKREGEENLSFTDALKEVAKDTETETNLDLDSILEKVETIEKEIEEAEENLEEVIEEAVEDSVVEEVIQVQPDNDSIMFSKFEIGGNRIGETFTENIGSNGVVNLIRYPNFGTKDISEYTTGVAKNLFTTFITFQDMTFENENRTISIFYKITNLAENRTFVAKIPSLTLQVRNRNFSINDIDLNLEISETGIENYTANSEDYIDFEENRLEMSFSQLLSDDFVKDGNYSISFGITGTFTNIYNAKNVAVDFGEDRILYGVSGNVEIYRANQGDSFDHLRPTY